jgi:hypothetical protein
MKKYLEVKANDQKVTHLKCEVYYSLGGFNYSRGYYASVTPVERSNGYGCTIEGYVAFSGYKQIVKPVNRKSAKAEAEAERLAQPVLDMLIEVVLKKNGLELAVDTVAETSTEGVA